MEFSSQTVVVREICNGAMFLSALFVIGIFANYVRHRCAEGFRRCLGDPVVLAALCIIVLMVGHAIRAGSSWMEFLWRDLDWDAGAWTNTETIFLTATALILSGKLLIVYVFAVWEWRWVLVALALMISVGVPLAVAALAAWWG